MNIDKPEVADQTLLLKEESVIVDKEAILTGKVRVTTRTEHFEQLVQDQVESTVVDVVRIRIDRTVDAIPAIKTEGAVTIIPVVEEVVFVEKRLVLREEIHVTRRQTTDFVELPVSLRRQRAVIEHLPADELQTEHSMRPSDEH